MLGLAAPLMLGLAAVLALGLTAPLMLGLTAEEAAAELGHLGYSQYH